MTVFDLFKGTPKDALTLSPPNEVYQPRKSEHPLVETSLMAYDGIKGLLRSKLKQEVLRYVITHPNRTQRDADEYFTNNGFQDEGLRNRYSVHGSGYSSVRSRYSELEREGLIKKDPGPGLVQAGEKRHTYSATGRQVPLISNAKMSYKKKFTHLYEFLIVEYNDNTSLPFKDRITKIFTEIGLDPAGESQIKLINAI
jgi:hypothetical protein